MISPFAHDRICARPFGGLPGMGVGGGIGGGRPQGWLAGAGATSHRVSGAATARLLHEGAGRAACGAKSKLTGGLDGEEPFNLEGCGCGGECGVGSTAATRGMTEPRRFLMTDTSSAPEGAMLVSTTSADDGSAVCGC